MKILNLFSKKFSQKTSKIISLILVVLAVSTCLVSCTNGESGSMENSNTNQSSTTNNESDNTSSSQNSTSTEDNSNSHNHNSNTDFILDVKAVPSEKEPGIINAVITLEHAHSELMAIQFELAFTSNTVLGVYETNDEMAKTMTAIPMYKTTLGASVPSFEQICSYNKGSSKYSCMYADLLQYPAAEPGQTFGGVKDSSEFTITIPFKVNSDVTVGSIVKFDLISGTISGTKSESFSEAYGQGTSATYVITEKDIVK